MAADQDAEIERLRAENARLKNAARELIGMFALALPGLLREVLAKWEKEVNVND